MKLTTRQIQILKFLAAGNGAEAIGKKLQLSDRTVEVHIRNAKAKLGAKNATHAVVLALKQKTITLKDL